ncbi:MAG: hypothetical protein JWN44_2106 [Myxococcales bacterium]|nr:hypothetical protein [Myxococcales bacterium]
MKRLASLAVIAVAAALSVAPAHADYGSGGSSGSAPSFGEVAPSNYQSSQWFALEIKFGPYSPNIDASPGLNGKTPFKDLFPADPGKSRPPGRLLTQVEFDVQILRRWYGNFGIGHSVGYYRRTTHSFAYDNTMGMASCGQPGTSACTRSGDTTALNVVPLSIMGVYRFDLLAHRWKIPFVPYFKIGIAYYMWWIENGGGFLSIANYTPPGGKSESGFGGTWGWVMNPGGAFLLDVLDPSAARTIDAELGINHSYIFCELHYADITGFGAANKMNLSDVTLNAGLAFEF